ncbi:MAG: hypothetical protein QOH96_3333 [Blastocatellia bacterium]|nr:hypothetical protein [Blastocatellia bacterium]
MRYVKLTTSRNSLTAIALLWLTLLITFTASTHFAQGSRNGRTVPEGSGNSGVPVLSDVDPDSQGLFGVIPSPLVMIALLGLGLGALVFVRHRNKFDDDGFENVELPAEAEKTSLPRSEEVTKLIDRRSVERRTSLGRRGQDLSNGLERAAQVTASLTSSAPRGPVSRISQDSAPALFGAYRVEQEVGKLALGQPHRMEVVGSRAMDDRRAIEVSLLKYLNLTDADEDGRRRARTALEEYGFVARQSAALLFANTAYERSSAARTLGEIASPASLPFLLEALYDNEEIVRVQAVTSLGNLKLPSAIGALLNMARLHPEMPSELISRALSACSVDCFDIGPGIPFDSDAFALGDVGIDFTGEITELDPVAFLEELPETTGDPVFLGILDRVKRTDGEERAEAVRSLGDFRVKQSVNALSQLAADQNEPVLRAAAITALGEIDHTSVFVPIIIALVEDAREVRAAAARALSGLSIDRADAYALVVQQSDPDTRHAVALACIKSGIARQAIERLSSVDKRQAYEAFATLAVLASSNEIATILDAMGQSDETLAIAATRVLGAAGLPDSLPALRQMAVRDAISENVRTAISEVIYKIDQNQPV